MHVQLDPDNAEKYAKAAHNINRSVGEIVNNILRNIDDIKYVEQMEFTMKKELNTPSPKKRTFKHQRSWINRF